ncbi:protein kinase, putative [Trypanosoma cruzi marinkellei]|uniref:Protein kinase, putative n=1 Tax=Trypanosoma cruzi marinkellei TaxID=85056 RepID=K2N4S9_TRYCR|nr:protein kinase, putative [Trypanosoma cruzi marinkellei]
MDAVEGTPFVKEEAAQKYFKKRVLCYEFDPEADLIGRGAYGEVYKATLVCPSENGTGKVAAEAQETFVALKRTRCADKEEGIPASTIREIMVLREISKAMKNGAGTEGSPESFGCENVVKLYDVFMDKSMVYMASEFCEAGDLACYLKTLPLRRLSDGQQYRQWMWDLLSGLCFLHRKGFSHRDLKPQNLVLKAIPSDPPSPEAAREDGSKKEPKLTPQYKLKITDFGLSRVEGIPVKKYQHEAVTLWYRSPDVLLGNTNYNYTADMWSAGCIIAEVASGNAFFRGKNNREQLKSIFSRLGLPTESNFPSIKQYALYETFFTSADSIEKGQDEREGNVAASYAVWFENVKKKLNHYFTRYGSLDIVGEDGVDLVARLLAYEPGKRLTTEEALQHPFFHTVSHGIFSAVELNAPPSAAASSMAHDADERLSTSQENIQGAVSHYSVTAVSGQSQMPLLTQPQEGNFEEAKGMVPTEIRGGNNGHTLLAGGGKETNSGDEKDKPSKGTEKSLEEGNNAGVTERNKYVESLNFKDRNKKGISTKLTSRPSTGAVCADRTKNSLSVKGSRVEEAPAYTRGSRQVPKSKAKVAITRASK